MTIETLKMFGMLMLAAALFIIILLCPKVLIDYMEETTH